MAPSTSDTATLTDAEVVIRVASARDASALACVSSALSRETRGSNPEHAMDEAAYVSFLSVAERGFCLIATSHNEIVAGLLVQFDSAPRRETRWWIHNAYVFPEMRGRGVFARLYAEVARRAATLAVKQLRVSVMPENRAARAAYARLGFRDITETIARERANSVTDPAVYTKLGLSEPPFRVLEATVQA